MDNEISAKADKNDIFAKMKLCTIKSELVFGAKSICEMSNYQQKHQFLFAEPVQKNLVIICNTNAFWAMHWY